MYITSGNFVTRYSLKSFVLTEFCLDKSSVSTQKRRSRNRFLEERKTAHGLSEPLKQLTSTAYLSGSLDSDVSKGGKHETSHEEDIFDEEPHSPHSILFNKNSHWVHEVELEKSEDQSQGNQSQKSAGSHQYMLNSVAPFIFSSIDEIPLYQMNMSDEISLPTYTSDNKASKLFLKSDKSKASFQDRFVSKPKEKKKGLPGHSSPNSKRSNKRQGKRHFGTIDDKKTIKDNGILNSFNYSSSSPLPTATTSEGIQAFLNCKKSDYLSLTYLDKTDLEDDSRPYIDCLKNANNVTEKKIAEENYLKDTQNNTFEKEIEMSLSMSAEPSNKNEMLLKEKFDSMARQNCNKMLEDLSINETLTTQRQNTFKLNLKEVETWSVDDEKMGLFSMGDSTDCESQTSLNSFNSNTFSVSSTNIAELDDSSEQQKNLKHQFEPRALTLENKASEQFLNTYHEHLKRIAGENEHKWKEIENQPSVFTQKISSWQWMHRNDGEEVISANLNVDDDVAKGTRSCRDSSITSTRTTPMVKSSLEPPKRFELNDTVSSIKKPIVITEIGSPLQRKPSSILSANIQRLIDLFEEKQQPSRTDRPDTVFGFIDDFLEPIIAKHSVDQSRELEVKPNSERDVFKKTRCYVTWFKKYFQLPFVIYLQNFQRRIAFHCMNARISSNVKDFYLTKGLCKSIGAFSQLSITNKLLEKFGYEWNNLGTYLMVCEYAVVYIGFMTSS